METKFEVTEMGEFEHMFVVFKIEMREVFEQSLDKMQQSMLKFKEYLYNREERRDFFKHTGY